MRDFVVPADTQESVARTFRQIHLMLRELNVPLLNDFRSVQGIAEGTSAYFMEGNTLYRYTKIGNKLHKEKVGLEDPPEDQKDASTVDVMRQVEVTAGEPRTFVVEYNRPADAPRAIAFDVEWYRLDDNQEPVEVPESERPTDVTFSPETPASTSGKHYVSITFTPQSFEEGIIARVIVKEASDA